MSGIEEDLKRIREESLEQFDAGTWGAHKRARRRKHLERELAELVPRVAEAEADMRRAFARWDKHRSRCSRIERELDRILKALDDELNNAPEASK